MASSEVMVFLGRSKLLGVFGWMSDQHGSQAPSFVPEALEVLKVQICAIPIFFLGLFLG